MVYTDTPLIEATFQTPQYLPWMQNDTFYADVNGWFTGASINAASTSLTRLTSDSPMDGITLKTCAELVTTATNGSGCNMPSWLQGPFLSGHTYRFSIWLKSVSGTTSAKILIGSLGTPADRASATMTLTTSWVRYQVEWTPSANRGDVQLNVTNNAASIMTARLAVATVIDTVFDLAPYLIRLSYTRGGSFFGSGEAIGSSTLRLDNKDGRFTIDNASSPLFGTQYANCEVHVRASYANKIYALCYGRLIRQSYIPADLEVEWELRDDLELVERGDFYPAGVWESILGYRNTIWSTVGFPPETIEIGSASPEWDEVLAGDTMRASLLGELEELNTATRSTHFMEPNPSLWILGKYRSLPRTDFQSGSAVETFNDDIAEFTNYDSVDESLIGTISAQARPRRPYPDVDEVIWTAQTVPILVPANTMRTIYPDSHVDRAASITASFVAYDDAPPTAFTGSIIVSNSGARIEIHAAAAHDAYISSLTLLGTIWHVVAADAATASATTIFPTYGGRRVKQEISSEFLVSTTVAQGLVDYIVWRYGAGRPRPTINVENRFPSQMLRQIGDRIALTFPKLSLSAKEYLITHLQTTVDINGRLWTTDYELEEAPPTATLFTIGGSAGQGIGGTGILAR